MQILSSPTLSDSLNFSHDPHLHAESSMALGPLKSLHGGWSGKRYDRLFERDMGEET